MRSKIFWALTAAVFVGGASATTAAAWGCVATGSDGGYGYSYNWPSEQDAELTALNQCEANSSGGDCSTQSCTHDEGG